MYSSYLLALCEFTHDMPPPNIFLDLNRSVGKHVVSNGKKAEIRGSHMLGFR